MTTERAIDVLKAYNKWSDMPNTNEFQQALDKAIEVMEESVTNKVTEKHRESFKPNYKFIDEEEQ